MTYDVFISYRRDGGEYTAKILRDRLQEAGYKVFFDVESLRSGDFNTKLYSVIDECRDFLLILSPGALDRCKNDDDWVRREVEYALEKGKNVIPIMLRGFAFPAELPPSMDAVRYRNGLEANSQFFDAFLQQLEQKFLLTKPRLKDRVRQNSLFRRVIPLVVALAVLAALGIGGKALADRLSSQYPRGRAEENITNEVLYYVMSNLTELDVMARYADDALQAAQRYLHTGGGDYEDLRLTVTTDRKAIEHANLTLGELQPGLMERLADSPFKASDLTAMHDTVTDFSARWVTTLDYFLWMLSDDVEGYTDAEKLEVVECYRRILEEDLKAQAYCCNQLLLPITREDALAEFWHEYLPGLTMVPLDALTWQRDYDALESAFRLTETRKQDILVDIAELTGKFSAGSDALAALSEDDRIVVQYLFYHGFDLETALQVPEAYPDTAENILSFRQALLPREGEGLEELWIRYGALTANRFYDDARACVDRYQALAGGNETVEAYVPAMYALVEFCRSNGPVYGVMVMDYYEPDGINPYLRPGDVILALDGKPCPTFEEYGAVKAQCGQEFTADVLRLGESGAMELVQVTLNKSMPSVYLNTVAEPVEE